MVELKGYGQFIKHHRLASGFKSQRKFAEVTGVSAATISRIEDELHRPAPETLYAFAKHLHTTSLVELMVVCGYWDKEELLEPLDENKIYKNEPKSSPASPAKELSIPIEELANHTLTYKGHVLTDEQKKQLVKILQAAVEMSGLDQK